LSAVGGAFAAARRAPRAAVALYWESGIVDDVPALAWFLLGALVPLALGMTAVATVVLGDYAQAQALAERAARVLPREVSDQLVQVILRTRRDSPLLIVFSIAGMVWTSAGAVGVLERAMSRLLERERFGPLRGKLRHLALGGALTVGIVLMALAASKTTGLQHRLGIAGPFGTWVLPFLGAAGTVLICAALYRYAPRGQLPWAAALRGAVPAGFGLQLIPTALALYLPVVAGRTPVEVFLVLAGVLFTCYLAAFALLLGAALAVRRHRSSPLKALDPQSSAASPLTTR
jgi:uncharacterized BrkB/YihY/UPF0761 family membrane protein